MFGGIKEILYFCCINKEIMNYTAVHHHYHFPNE